MVNGVKIDQFCALSLKRGGAQRPDRLSMIANRFNPGAPPPLQLLQGYCPKNTDGHYTEKPRPIRD